MTGSLEPRSTELERAIENAYVAFNARKPRAIEGCPCCTDKNALCRLLENNLRDLTPNELSDYGSSVFLTMGDSQDFKYFLPRLLEIAANEDWWPSPEVLLGKLKLARWQNWSDGQRSAVELVIDAWYAKYLDAERLDGSDIDALLCGIAHAELPLARYLDALTKRPAELQAFFDIHSQSFFRKKRLANEFWKECPSAEQLVLDYLDSPAVRTRLGA